MRTCETQLLVTAYNSYWGGGGGVDVILLDFYKAFHMVPHQRLLHKLQYNEVGNNTLSWIQSFLSGRIQQVALKGTL